MDMRPEQGPWAEAAIREPKQQASEGDERKFQQTHVEAKAAAPSACKKVQEKLNAAHPLPPGQLVETTVASPLTSVALADWQRGRDASRSTGGAGGAVPELVKRMLAAQDSGGWTSAEDELIRASVPRLGYMWGVIAAALPGRSDGAVHSRWNRLEAMRTDGHQSVTLSHARRAERLLILQEVRPAPVVRVWSCSKGCGEMFTHGRTAAWSIRQHEEMCMGGGIDPQWRTPCTAASAVAASTDASTAGSTAASIAAERTDTAAAAAKENVEMQRAPATACPSHATKRTASRPKLQPKLPPNLCSLCSPAPPSHSRGAGFPLRAVARCACRRFCASLCCSCHR